MINLAKYIQFDLGKNEPVFYEVNNFSLESIEKLPIYKEKWLVMSFLEGEKRMFDGKILDIYPSQLIGKVYYGKKLTYAEVKQIVGNDIRYNDLLWQMEKNCRDSFCALNVNTNNDEEYYRQFKDYTKNFDRTHYCLFTLPNNFSILQFDDNKTMTVEEFDNRIKLDYTNILNNIQSNAHIGKDYLNKNQLALKLFKNYFEMLLKNCKNYNEDTIKSIFSICQFHFENFTNLQTIEEINFFLEVADYTYQLSNYNRKLFNQYKDFVNMQYKELEEGSTLDFN